MRKRRLPLAGAVLAAAWSTVCLHFPAARAEVVAETRSPFSVPAEAPYKHSMVYRPLGKTGLRVSALSYGAWLTFSEQGQVGIDRAKTIMRACIQEGINFFDNAEGYGAFIGESEQIMGEGLRQIFREGGVQRTDLVISTKLWRGGTGINDKGLSRKHILEGMAASLKRMQLDYVDLVYAHRFDPTTPVEEVVRAFSHLVDTGKALYWGTSEWTAEEIQRAQGIAARLHLHAPVMEQPLYNLMFRDRVEIEYRPLIHGDRGLGLTTYSPLAEGILAGRYLDGIPTDSRGNYKEKLLDRKEQIEVAQKLKPVADRLGVTLAQLSLAWCLKNEEVSSVIMGASKAEQVHENVQALRVLGSLTGEVKREMEELAAGAFAPRRDHTKKIVNREIGKQKGPYFGSNYKWDEL